MTTGPAYRVAVVFGDGIGPSVVEAACAVLDATEVPLRWISLEMGIQAFHRIGQALAPSILEDIRDIGVVLKGPLETRPDSPFASVNVRLRRELGLRAQVRPVRNIPGLPSRFVGIDLMVVRETTEDLYQGIEFHAGTVAATELVRWLGHQGHQVASDSGLSIKPISGSAIRAFLEIALRYLNVTERRHVTIVHKATVMRATDALFVSEASAAMTKESRLDFDTMTVDAMASALVRRPQDFDVILTTNQYGDILSDLASGLTGGVGLAPGMNLGPGIAIFEAAHGTAPRHVDVNSANPLALILSGAMLLDHLGEHLAAGRVRLAVESVVAEGTSLPADLRPGTDSRPAATTDQVAAAVIAHL